MDIKNMSDDEIKQLKADIAKTEEDRKQEKIRDKQRFAAENIELARQYKDVIMQLIQHGRTSCSDDDVCNGYGSASYGARCNKCHLIEILNGEWGNKFDIEFRVEIYDTEN